MTAASGRELSARSVSFWAEVTGAISGRHPGGRCSLWPAGHQQDSLICRLLFATNGFPAGWHIPAAPGPKRHCCRKCSGIWQAVRASAAGRVLRIHTCHPALMLLTWNPSQEEMERERFCASPEEARPARSAAIQPDSGGPAPGQVISLHGLAEEEAEICPLSCQAEGHSPGREKPG